jgi:hypothetical protein
MRQLKVRDLITPTLRTRPDMIEGRAHLLPDRRVRNVEPPPRHELAADRAAAFLPKPEIVE